MATKNEPVLSKGKGEGDFVMTRVFDAPRELVWQAWTDQKHLARWWGPHMFTNPVCEIDLRPGGAWRIEMQGPQGERHPAKGVYREIAQPERLVFTIDHSDLPDAWHDMVNPGRDRKAGKPSLEALVTVTLEEEAGKTKMTIAIRFESAAVRDALVKLGMTQGWSQSLERLEAAVGGPAAAFTSTRVFKAPRDLVFKAFAEPERLAQWWGPRGTSMKVAKFEFRPGGVCHYSLRSPDGREMWGKFVYREIVPPGRLVFVNSFSDAGEGITTNPYIPNWPEETLTTLTFTEQAGETTIMLHAIPINATELQRQTFEAGRAQMGKGFGSVWAQLADYLAEA